MLVEVEVEVEVEVVMIAPQVMIVRVHVVPYVEGPISQVIVLVLREWTVVGTVAALVIGLMTVHC